MNEEILKKFLLFIAAIFICLNFRIENVKADGIIEVSTNAENGKIYVDNADLMFFSKGCGSEFFTYFNCMYTDASGVSSVLEETVTRHDGSDLCIEKNYNAEGIYDINFYCTDVSGIASDIISVSIAVDSKAPEITFSNAENGAVYKGGIDLGVEVKEMFYDLITVDIDASVTADDDTSKLVIPYDVQATANKNIYKFEGSGKYELNVTAADAGGHAASEKLEFSIDDEPPDIKIKNGDTYISGDSVITSDEKFLIEVADELSGVTEGEITLNRKCGNIYTKIHSYNLGGADFKKQIEIPSEGFYTVKVTAFDGVGNSVERVVYITYDKSAPVVEYFSQFNEKYLNSFTVPDSFKYYIKDLTDTVYKAYLNSKLLSGGEIIDKDGKYLLQIVASDEALNTHEELVAFIIDNTHPKIVLSGLDSSGVVNDGVIKLSLLDSDDYFESVVINGESIPFEKGKNELNIKTDAYENYEICVTAKDFAGNETVETIKAKSALAGLDKTNRIKNMKSLTKNGSKNRELFSAINSGVGFWVFCTVTFIIAVIFIGFALFDISKIT